MPEQISPAVLSVAGRGGAVTLKSTDLTDWSTVAGQFTTAQLSGVTETLVFNVFAPTSGVSPVPIMPRTSYAFTVTSISINTSQLPGGGLVSLGTATAALVVNANTSTPFGAMSVPGTTSGSQVVPAGALLAIKVSNASSPPPPMFCVALTVVRS